MRALMRLMQRVGYAKRDVEKEARLLARLGITAGAMQQRQRQRCERLCCRRCRWYWIGEESFGFAPNQGSQSPDAGASATPCFL